MSLVISKSLLCDGPGEVGAGCAMWFAEDTDDSTAAIRVRAQRAGWIRLREPGRSSDLCPDCARKIAPEVTATVGTGAFVRDLLTRRSEVALRFVQHRRSGVVHVLVPRDPDADDEPLVTAPDNEVQWRGWLIASRTTLCGYIARVDITGGGHGHDLVSAFEDHLLCARCYTVLGPHTDRAFEHPTPATATATETSP
jgi:hypothetical protein